MSRFLRSSALSALALAASCAVAGAASAQSYDRLVVFGDSLSDNGNLYAATGGAQPPAPFYTDGRFSTGPVFTERLGFDLARVGGNVNGSIDFAYGGARTDMTASPPGMLLQLAMYRGMGGSFDSGDLVSVLGGANNIFQALPAAGASANPLAAISPVSLAAANDVNNLVDSVAGLGAGTVLVTNLPKLSLTPQFRGTAAAPLADYAVNTFNTALLTGLQATALDRPNTNIIVVDLFKVGDFIAANPEAFGVDNVTQSCINPVTGAICSNPDDLFYTDGVHPTAVGHAAIAKLALDYMYYGDIGAQSAVQAETSLRHREDRLDDATDMFGDRAPWSAGTAIIASGSVDRTETDARGGIAEAKSDGYGLTLGLSSGPSSTLRFTGTVGYNKADVDAGAMTFDVDSYSADIGMGWRSADGGAFISAAAGAAVDNFVDIHRVTTLAPIVHDGKTDGVSTGARVQGGLWFDMGGLAISPRAAVTWSNTDVEGYVEQGPGAQYVYADRDVSGVTGEVTLRAEGDMGSLGFFVEGGYRDSLSDDSDAVGVSLFNNTARVLETEVDEPYGGQILVRAGLSGDVGPVKVSLSYRGRFGDEADSHMGLLSLTLPLQ